MSDTLTVLTTADGRRLAKVIRAVGDGVEVDGYEAGSRYRHSAIKVDGLGGIEQALWRLAEDRTSCVIRGELRDSARHSATVNRCQHVQTDGRSPDWDHARPGRRWVAFDIDKMPCSPPALGVVTDDWLVSLVRQARDRLPEPFRSASCAFKLSSSAGLDGWETASLHLWYWLDRPVYDLSWRRWAEGVAVDPSLFRAVQPHYTADPVFEGARDPLAGLRVGQIIDGPEVVAVPPQLSDYAGWLAVHKAELAVRAKELEAARARIVEGLPQSASATRRYALQTLSGAVSDLLGAPVGGRHAELVSKAYKLGGYIQDGFLAEHEVLSTLEQAVSAVFPAARHREEIRTAREMVAAGMLAPLDLAHIGRGAGQAAARPRLTVVKDPPRGHEEGSAAVDIDDPPPRKAPSGWVDYPDLGAKKKVLTTAPNLAALLASMGIRPWRNLMNHNTEWDRPAGTGDIARECLQATMMSDIIDAAARTGWGLGEAGFYRGLGALEAANAVHPVAEWVQLKPWDGVSRIEELFKTLVFAPDYERFRPLLLMQLRKWLVAGGKCLTAPRNSARGVDVQGVLVLQGAQDIGKTRWFKSLVPDVSWVAEGVTMDPSNKDSVIEATSSFIVELGELDATTRKADVAMLKSFLTRDVDEYRAPYGRKREAYPRRTIYGATVNPSEFLVDQTGNRRFWLMPCASIVQDAEVDMQQVWAEACVLAQSEGHWMPGEFKSEQQELAKCFAKRSPWADDFYSRFRHPVDEDMVPPRMSVASIRAAVDPHRNWNQADMSSFTAFLRGEGFDMGVQRGVMHARVVGL